MFAPNMLVGIKHLHVTAVIIFILLFAIKTILLLLNKNEAKDKFYAKTKIFDISVSAIFFITGLVLFLLIPRDTVGILFYVKLVLTLLSIPLGIIAMKKYHKIMALLTIILLLLAYGFAEMSSKVKPKTDGKAASVIYAENCVSCHGPNGDAKLLNSPDLTKSTLSDADIKLRIVLGKGLMKKFDIEGDQLDSLVAYVKTLRK